MVWPLLALRCGGEIEFERIALQYQEELPEPRPIVREVKVYIGCCGRCGKRHQGRHPYQTSDALGAAGLMLGARGRAGHAAKGSRINNCGPGLG